MTADELLDMETEPMDWIWKPYLPAGALALLSAFPKVGKSTLAYSLAVAVAQGQPFLGTPTKQGPVLILAVEEHPREARWRLVKFGLRRGDPIYVHVGAVNAADGLREVAEWVQDRGHTFASRLVMEAVDLYTVQLAGGWKTQAMVQRYAHLSPDHMRAAVERLAKAPSRTESVTKSVTDVSSAQAERHVGT